MGYIYAALLLASIWAGILAVERNNAALVTPSPQLLQNNNDAGLFVAYRNAVAVYMAAHPTFTGSVPAASLVGQFSQSFLAEAGNNVTATGTAARIITCYANVSQGTLREVLVMTGGDAAIGKSNGATWTSAAPNAVQTPTALNVPVQSGDIVSVIQIGT
jgi:hypothetical protein